ncbi:cadherin-15 [Bombina bombina]|uniref:cadherin-15 n=1 Tax=Bombina bombina TaxID=8345 RepID=UPI00235A4D9F|nr:cadherin-15 [Bombina bombina]
MESQTLLALCFLVPFLWQVHCTEVQDEPTPDVPVFYPWRNHNRSRNQMQRVKRAWVIPPISVSENNKKIPVLLVQIKSDKQRLGSVIYSIKGPGVDEEPKGLFSINKNTGAMYLNAVLDREKTERFKIQAFAVDTGGTSLEDPTDLEIVVVDQNDNRPVFIQDVFRGHVLEGTIPGTLVMTVEATDDDDPTTDNAELKYSIIEQEIPEMFSINQKTGEIRTVQAGLDREVVGTYRLTVQVGDMYGEGLTSTAKAVITIGDINDNPPEFAQNEYFMEVSEHSSNIVIGRLNVTDKDLPNSPNWKVQYVITSGDPEGLFSIRTDPLTNEGILSVAKTLDHEAREVHQLTVSAQNEVELSSSAPRTTQSQTKVTVKVLDVNEPPFFWENPKVVSLKERSPPGTELCVYTAKDLDTMGSQDISYTLISDPADWLMLDTHSGQIKTRYTLDRKSTLLHEGWYTALIIASDNADPPLSSTGTLSVEVLEVNDHAPVLWQYPGVLCNKPQQGQGILLSATDNDLPPHSHPFKFKLDQQHTELTLNWSISQINGTHSLLKLLAEVQDGVHVLPLWVSDSGDPPLAREQLLNVSVCQCDSQGICRGSTAALFSSGAGISLSALLIIMSSVALLLLLVLLLLLFRCSPKRRAQKGLLFDSEDDIRDNIFNYNEQGGGEEDQDGFDMNRLRNPEMSEPPSPRLKPPIRRDAPYSQTLPRYPRRPTNKPSDIADFINDGLQAADADPSVPPYDTALIYDYEGEGSVVGSLSSILSTEEDSDQEYDYLQEWGPRFRRLADMYSHQ